MLHCPSDVGNNAWILSRAERKLGINSDVMVFTSNWLEYHSDINLQLKERSFFGKIFSLLSFFTLAITHYDIFHFNFGKSLFSHFPGPLALLNQADLPMLKILKKGMLVTYQGCDIRQREYCMNHFEISACSEPDCGKGICNREIDSLRAKKAGMFSRYADKIYALNPDLLWLLPTSAEFLPYTTIDLNGWRPATGKRQKTETFLIVHAPTNKSVKGTRFIFQAVQEIQKKYPNVELKLIQGIPHNQVREIYQRADLAIDQLLLGWYGGFAVEAMALGKPVIAYIREQDLQFIPEDMRKDLPILRADPANLTQVLEQVMGNREMLPIAGERGRAYVEKWHDPIKIAKHTIKTYEQILDRSKRGK